MLRLVSIAMAVGLMMPSQILAADVEVLWQEPDKYRDIQSTQIGQNEYKDRVMEAFNKKFYELAQKLPEDQLLQITVTDVDLAGRIVLQDFGAGVQNVRIIEGLDYPGMALSYKLFDADGNVLKEGENRLKGHDLPGQGISTPQRRRGSNIIEYETPMVERWFRNTFERNG